MSLDAYGFTGPWHQRRGFDSLVQMSSGIAFEGMLRTGRDQPTPLPAQALDHATGYLLAAAALRGLRASRAGGRVTPARCSLARTARLLIEGPSGRFDDTLEPVDAGDYADTVEATGWGLARRLRPPMTIEGVAFRWDRPADALGTSPAAW